MNRISFGKLDDGSWGVRVAGDLDGDHGRLQGQTVLVSKADGSSTQVTLRGARHVVERAHVALPDRGEELSPCIEPTAATGGSVARASATVARASSRRTARRAESTSLEYVGSHATRASEGYSLCCNEIVDSCGDGICYHEEVAS